MECVGDQSGSGKAADEDGQEEKEARLVGVEAQIGIRMKDARLGKPVLRDSYEPWPSQTSEVRAACSNSARADPRGGRQVTGVKRHRWISVGTGAVAVLDNSLCWKACYPE